MNVMDINVLWKFLEDAESLVESVQDEIILHEDDPDQDEIATCILQIEGAVADLNRTLACIGLDMWDKSRSL